MFLSFVSKARRLLGAAEAICSFSFVVYMVYVMSCAGTASDTTLFSGSQMGFTSACMLMWVGGAFAHGVYLWRSGKPMEPLGILALLGLFFAMKATLGVPHDPSTQTPTGLYFVALWLCFVIPPLVQLLDLFVPPYLTFIRWHHKTALSV